MRSFDEMDGRSSRLEREAAQRRDEAKKRAEKERLAKQKFDADAAVAKRELEAKRKRDAAIAEAREAAALEQSRLTGGVRWQKTYRSGAVARHGDRVSLPQSALEDLTALGVLDGAGTALTFELELVDPATGKVSGVREAEFVDAAGRRSRARAARATRSRRRPSRASTTARRPRSRSKPTTPRATPPTTSARCARCRRSSGARCAARRRAAGRRARR